VNNIAVTILSDLGPGNPSLAVLKLMLMNHCNDIVPVEITNRISEYNLENSAYVLQSAYRHFPAGSVHIVAADVFGGNSPRLLAAQKEGHYFIAPDNGVLPLAFGETLENTRLFYEFIKPYNFKDWSLQCATLAQNILNGEQFPAMQFEIEKGIAPNLRRGFPDGVDCGIRHIDRYGNVVLDINKGQFEQLIGGKPFRIRVPKADDIAVVSTNYNQVAHGQPLCKFNEAGYLEISLNHAPIDALLGISQDNLRTVRYRTVKIFF
jgi:S-adenosyl-L-methionine hydrolase (adenosine-forming)